MTKSMVITYQFEKNLYVNTTNRCNLNCFFCLRHNGDSVGDASSLWLEREPTREEILADLEGRDLSRYEQLVFCGYGEPTYRFDDICAVIDSLHAQGKKPFIRMDTNGTGSLICGRDICPEFAGRFDKVSVSLNAEDAQKYAARCGGPQGAYEAMKDFTRELCRYVPHVLMTVVDKDMPKEEIETCGKICAELGAEYRVRAYIPD